MYMGQAARKPLDGTPANASGFINRMLQQGIPYDPQVWRADFGVQEWMFRDASYYGGQDHLYADNVDMLFFTGHAFSDGWQAANAYYGYSKSYGDGWVGRNEVRFGNQDLEWLIIAACGPLQEYGALDASSAARWLPAFDGLHLMLGYSTVSDDAPGEGYTFADNLIRRNMLVRDAWVDAAMTHQDWYTGWAYMGVIGPNNTHTFNDKFKGPVGPDIKRFEHRGYYVHRGNS